MNAAETTTSRRRRMATRSEVRNRTLEQPRRRPTPRPKLTHMIWTVSFGLREADSRAPAGQPSPQMPIRTPIESPTHTERIWCARRRLNQR